MKRFAVLIVIAMANCGPNYESGKTQCSDKGECPSGYYCGVSGTTRVCFSKKNDSGVVGGGGAGGTGGTQTTNAGSGGSTISKTSSTGGALGSGGITIVGGSGGNKTSSTGGTLGNGGITISSGNGGSFSGSGGSSYGSGGNFFGGGGSSHGSGGSSSGSGGIAATPSGTSVTFSNGQAVGAMTGLAWVALGSADTLTDPLCGSAQITSTPPCVATTWSTTNSLCISGAIPALDATTPDYNSNWGIQLGIDVTKPFGSGLGQSFSTIAITVSGSPTSGLRAMLHRKGDKDETNYCLAMISGTVMPMTSFNTKCYDLPPDGDALFASDIPNIDKVGVQVSSSATAITVDNLCVTGITFGK
jgi:hypothetical protein